MAFNLTNNGTVKFPPVGPTATVATFTKANSEKLANLSINPDWGWGVTQAFWMRIPTTATAGEGYLVFGQYGPIWGGGGWLLGDQNSSAGLLSLSVTNSTEVKSVSWGENIADGLWHFIVLRYNPSTLKASISVDLATPVETAALASHPVFSASYDEVQYGTQGFLGSFMDANLSRAGIWNYHLENAALETLFNFGRGLSYAELPSTLKADSRLMAYHNLDEASGNRADSYGAYTLTDTNTVTSTTCAVPANLPGTAAGFLASRSEYLSHASPDDILGAGLRDWTVVVWVAPGEGNVNDHHIFNFGASNYGPACWLSNNYGGEYRLYLWGASAPFVNIGDWRNRWMMLVAKYSATNLTLTAAMFGSVTNSGVYITPFQLTYPVSDTYVPQYFQIGRTITYGRYFQGQMSRLMVFSKQLSDDEVNALYGGGAGMLEFFGTSISPSASTSPSSSTSPSASASPSHSLSVSSSVSPSASQSPSASVSASISASSSASQSPSASISASSSASQSPSASASESSSLSPSASTSPSPSAPAYVPFAAHATLGDVSSYWAMEEARGTRYDSVDASNKDLLATWPGYPLSTASGKSGNAANFIQSELHSLTIPNFVFAPSFTLSMWVYGFDGYPGTPANAGQLFACAASYPNQSQILLSNGGYFGSAIVGDGSSYVQAAGFYGNWVDYSSGPHWALIIVDYDSATKKVRYHVRDGVNTHTEESAALSGTRDATAATLFFGSDHLGTAGSYSTNRFDEIGYWTRVLTAGERTDLWNSGAGLFY